MDSKRGKGVNSIVGYGFAALGLIALILTIDGVRAGIQLPEYLTKSALTIIGLVLVVIGVVLLKASGVGRAKQSAEEVPIYKGKTIVGYRRAK
ncbi:MAG: hypothetical protein ACE5ES_00015 [Candidatus Nanoarchaeia archaeon]